MAAEEKGEGKRDGKKDGKEDGKVEEKTAVEENAQQTREWRRFVGGNWRETALPDRRRKSKGNKCSRKLELYAGVGAAGRDSGGGRVGESSDGCAAFEHQKRTEERLPLGRRRRPTAGRPPPPPSVSPSVVKWRSSSGGADWTHTNSELLWWWLGIRSLGI